MFCVLWAHTGILDRVLTHHLVTRARFHLHGAPTLCAQCRPERQSCGGSGESEGVTSVAGRLWCLRKASFRPPGPTAAPPFARGREARGRRDRGRPVARFINEDGSTSWRELARDTKMGSHLLMRTCSSTSAVCTRNLPPPHPLLLTLTRHQTIPSRGSVTARTPER